MCLWKRQGCPSKCRRATALAQASAKSLSSCAAVSTISILRFLLLDHRRVGFSLVGLHVGQERSASGNDDRSHCFLVAPGADLQGSWHVADGVEVTRDIGLAVGVLLSRLDRMAPEDDTAEAG